MISKVKNDFKFEDSLDISKVNYNSEKFKPKESFYKLYYSK